jgi:hypothetical protein
MLVTGWLLFRTKRLRPVNPYGHPAHPNLLSDTHYTKLTESSSRCACNIADLALCKVSNRRSRAFSTSTDPATSPPILFLSGHRSLVTTVSESPVTVSLRRVRVPLGKYLYLITADSVSVDLVQDMGIIVHGCSPPGKSDKFPWFPTRIYWFGFVSARMTVMK